MLFSGPIVAVATRAC